MRPTDTLDPIRAFTRNLAMRAVARLRAVLPIILMVAMIGAALAIWWSVWSLARGTPHGRLTSLPLPLAIMLVAAVLWVGHYRRWVLPARRLLHTIRQIRCGQAPIDELSRIGGRLGSLAPLIQELFHELRQQKLAMAQLEAEIHQRIAVRTSALERQIGSLRQQAVRDPLTGLYNRRMLDACLPGFIQRCTAEQSDLSLLAIDVDYFKLLNDTLGHAAGDQLLRDIGQIIRSGIRAQDAAFRTGGDEFIVVLPGVTPQDARATAERLTRLVEELVKPLRLSCPPKLSIGVFSLSELPGNPTVGEMTAIADKRLYQIKSARHRQHQHHPRHLCEAKKTPDPLK
ncbi:GGDEF domain-containing protein [Fontivita pretiosa]|uniref:GGDEF domain-containing protein n=1 Tax=Fontivita pretiosa TaxID=2989684 RepID=UPI003D170D15